MQRDQGYRVYGGWLMVLALLVAALSVGCQDNKKKPPVKPKYADLGKREVPAFLKDTILERTDLEATEPFAVSAYSLVVNLRNTGDSTAPTAVRDYMVRQLTKHLFGQKILPGYQHMQPEEILRDKRVAIVRVDAFIPPGARERDRFDVQVSALPESYTSSLAHGQLYDTELHVDGADPVNPGGKVNVYGRVGSGQVFVNPVYALGDATAEAAARAKASLRYGIILDGGLAVMDRALILRVRTPQFSVARAMESRINERFQAIRDKTRSNGDMGNAEAQDDGMVNFYVPRQHPGGWEHFARVVQHLYLNGSPEYSAAKAKELVDEARKPGAPLEDISCCWEGLGQSALPFVQALYADPSPEIAFAAARAGAYLGDSSANRALLAMAQTSKHAFQLSAVQALGSLPGSPAIRAMLRKLLESPEALVRVEAYRILAAYGDGSVFSKVIQEKFVLDVVHCSGPPLVYATRTGIPRLAILGDRVGIQSPITFTAMSDTFMISGAEPAKLTVYYRGAELVQAVKQEMSGDLATLAARLGGEGADRVSRFDFTYGDVVAIVQSLCDASKVWGVQNSERVATTFVLQDLPKGMEVVYSSPAVAQTKGAAELPDLTPGSAQDSRKNSGAGRPQ